MTESGAADIKESKPLILVVDDHESQRELFRILAGRIGVTAHIVANGPEALEAAETYRFDAILMDVIMPNMTGLECTRLIRQMEKRTHTHVPIIAITACVLPGDKQNCLDSGMDDYLPKPFSLLELRDKLNRWLKKA